MSMLCLRSLGPVLRLAALAVAAFALSACEKTEAPASDPANAAARPETSPPVAVAPTLDMPAFAAGMSTAEAEALLADAGWLPLRDRETCLDGAGEAARLCRTRFALHACVDNVCALHYAHPAGTLTLRLNVAAPAPAADTFGVVRDWDTAALPAQPAAMACPATDFEGFLRAYAGDAQVRVAFTAPLVRVTQSVDREEAGYLDVQTLELGTRYTGFSFTMRDGAFHVVDSAGGVSPTAVELEVRPESGGAYFVALPGSVEGLSYRFERIGDCWRLTQDPEPAAS